MTELSTLFTLSGLLLYSKGRFRQTKLNRNGSVHVCTAILLMLPLALLSKENGILLLPLIIVFEIFIFRFRFPDTLDGKITKILTYINVIAILAGIAIILALFNSHFLPAYQFREFSLSERIYTELRALVFYLFIILIPVQQYMGFYHDDMIISQSLFDPLSTLAALTLILALLALAWKTRHRAPLFGLGVFFFFTAHSLESSILPLELVFEHRNYLPSIGIIIALLGIRDYLPIKAGKYLVSGMVIMTLLSSVVTYMRVQTWSDSILFNFYTYATHDNSPRANIIQANSLASLGEYEQAYLLLSKFSGPGYTLNKLYIQCLEQNLIRDDQLEIAGHELHQWLRTYELSGLIKIANLGLDNQCRFSNKYFLDLLNTALRQNFNRVQQKQNIMMYKAHYQYKNLNHEAAITTAVKAYEINTISPAPLAMAIEWLAESGQTELASEYLQRIKTLSEKHGGKYKRLIRKLETKTTSRL